MGPRRRPRQSRATLVTVLHLVLHKPLHNYRILLVTGTSNLILTQYRCSVQVGTWLNAVLTGVTMASADPDKCKQLLRQPCLTDFAITCDGITFKVHKVILHLHSAYFAAMFRNEYQVSNHWTKAMLLPLDLRATQQQANNDLRSCRKQSTES